jgi:hypothetical protein
MIMRGAINGELPKYLYTPGKSIAEARRKDWSKHVNDNDGKRLKNQKLEGNGSIVGYR